VIKVAIAAPIPALTPSTFTINKKNSSTDDGVVNSVMEIFSGFANFITFTIALSVNTAKRILETILACFF